MIKITVQNRKMKTSDAFTNNVLSAFILVQPKGQFKIYNAFYLLRFVTKRIEKNDFSECLQVKIPLSSST